MANKTKKGTSEMWWIIAAAVIALIAVIIIIVWFSGTGERLFDNIDQSIVGLKDYDQDGTSDLLDKCPCDADKQKLAIGEVCLTDKDKCAEDLKKQK